MILCEHRRTLWSEQSDIRPFMPGATIEQIVAAFDTPAEFERFGAVYLKRSEADGGHLVLRCHWHRIRPKAGTALFISCVPQGGGGDGGKQVFQLAAAVALIALTAWAGGGGLALLAPSIFAGNTAAVAIGVAAIGVAGSVALSLLSKPATGAPALGGGGGAAVQLGVAGIAQNPITAYAQLPAVRGIMRVSPPLLARPYTALEDTDQVLHMIVGLCGPLAISQIKINETDIDDMPAGVLDYEVREGWTDDAALTLVTESVFQENINLTMSQHRIDTEDYQTLIEPAASSYPKAHIFRTARNTDRFRITLNCASGVGNIDNNNNVGISFRIRIRRVVDTSPQPDWINLPETILVDTARNPFRQEIWLQWGNDADEDDLATGGVAATRKFKRVYYLNSEWTADSYFDDGVTGAVRSTLKHVYPDADGITFFLNTDEFPLGQYDVEITRGFADAGSNSSDTSYTTGLFTSRTAGPPESIPSQRDRIQTVIIENYASFRSQYPIAARGIAMIAIKARNLQVNSLSAIFGSYVDGVVTNNPADLLNDVWQGDLNARPVGSAQIEDMSDFATHCQNNSLTCDLVVTDGSLDQVSQSIANCGDAIVRRSDKWGVVIDKDRSAEAVSAFFQPGNMTSPLTIKKTFVTGARALIPSFNDASRDYQNRELAPVFDDDVPSSEDTLTEAVPYDGLTDEDLVNRRALLDLRRSRLRTLEYSWGVHLAHLRSKKGALSGLQADILRFHVATGRVKSFEESGGNLTSVTLNTDIFDVPVGSYSSVWQVENVWNIGNWWDLETLQLGMQIELEDATIATIPIAAIAGRTLTVDGTVMVPDGLVATSSRNGGSLVAVGPLERETRRVILTHIIPKDDYFAELHAIDEASSIFAGL